MSNADRRRQRALAYALDIDEIDAQHGMLFDYLDQLESALGADERWMVVHDIVEKLGHWAAIHFSVEEALMQIMDFPEAESHAADHRAFERGLESRRANLLKQDMAHDTADWLRAWLVNHIGVADRRYAEFFRERVAANPVS